MHLREAQIRRFLSRQPSLLLMAVPVLALCVGLGFGLVLRARSAAEEPEAARTPLSTVTGRLRLETFPPGATVTVNGGAQPGVTPMTVEGVPAGVTQSVTIDLKGYRRVVQELTLEPADVGRIQLLVNLVPESQGQAATKPAVVAAAEPRTSDPPEPASSAAGKRRDRDRDLEPGFLVLDSEPAMEVRVNRRTLGRTPLKGTKLSPGTYSVQLTAVDFAKTVEVTIRPGKTTTSKIVLEKGKLLIDVQPWADVYVHNRKIGKTPLAPYELYEGDYKIRIINPELAVDRTLPVTIRRGATTRVLEKL